MAETKRPRLPELDEAKGFIEWFKNMDDEVWNGLSDSEHQQICQWADLCGIVITIAKRNGQPRPGGAFVRG